MEPPVDIEVMQRLEERMLRAEEQARRGADLAEQAKVQVDLARLRATLEEAIATSRAAYEAIDLDLDPDPPERRTIWRGPFLALRNRLLERQRVVNKRQRLANHRARKAFQVIADALVAIKHSIEAQDDFTFRLLRRVQQLEDDASRQRAGDPR